MQNIVVVENTETEEERLKKYEHTGHQHTFLELENRSRENKIKYLQSNSVDKLIRSVLQLRDCFTIPGPQVIETDFPVFYRENKTAPILLKYGRMEIGMIYLRKREILINTAIDVLLDRPYVIPAQYECAVTLDAIKLYQCIFRQHYNYEWINKCCKIESDVDIFEPKMSLPFTKFHVELTQMAKSLNISPYAVMAVKKFSHDYFLAMLTGNNYKDDIYKLEQENLNKLLESEKQATWYAIMMWIAREFNIPLEAGKKRNKLFSEGELKIILKRKNEIINKFLAPPCNHDKYSKDLKLNGDFYECSHGKKIMCRHHTVEIKSLDEFMDEFAEEIVTYVKSCRICGEELTKNPDLVKSGYSPNISKYGFDDELRKLVFKKSIMSIVNVEFSGLVSDEYVKKFASVISNMIFNHVSDDFYKLDKIKGYPLDIIAAMKEITVNLYVYCALMQIVSENPKIVKFRGTRKQDESPQEMIRRAVSILTSNLRIYLDKIKDFKSINIVNVIQSMMETLKSKKAKIPTEFTRFTERDMVLYKFFEQQDFNMSQFPVITYHDVANASKMRNETNKILIDFLQMKLLIGEPLIRKDGDNSYIFNDDFNKWLANLQLLKKIEEEYVHAKNILVWRSRPPIIHKEEFVVDIELANLIYGLEDFHKHRFNETIIDGKKINLTQVPLEKSGTVFYCHCGFSIGDKKQIKNKNIDEEITNYLVNKNKFMYFSNYCPKKFTHKFVNNVCTYCGFTQNDIKKNTKFFEHNHLPDNNIKIYKFSKQHETKLEHLESVKFEDAKYYGAIPKLAYKNFWINLCCYEDVTYKSLLSGKAGNRTVATAKLLMLYNWLAQLLSRITNLTNMPNTNLQKFTGHDVLLLKLINELNDISWRSIFAPNYEYLRDNYIKIFNKLPEKLAEMVIRDMMRNAEMGSLSEENVKAEALITYKTKEIHDHTDVEESTGEKNIFTYEEFDYDGRNEK